VCASAQWGVQAPAAFSLCIAFVVIIAWSSFGLAGIRAAPRVMWLGLVAGLTVPAAAGLMVVAGLAGVLLVLALTATSPVLRAFVGRRWPGLLDTQLAAAAVASPMSPVGPEPPFALFEEPLVLPTDLAVLDDEALCLAWRHSFLLLEGARSEPERMRVVRQRERYLDELQRRCPQGFAAWLAAGARASGNPLPFLVERGMGPH
jgi:hypothetical protein